MRVAIYAGMFEENKDGATKTLYELTESLLENRIEVGVWAFKITPREKKGLSLYTIPSIPLPIYPDYKISLPNPKLTMQLLGFSPDIIHITVPDIVGIFLMRFATSRGIPVLTSYHTDFPSYLKSYRLGIFYKPSWRFLEWFYNKSQTVLAPTEIIINKLQSHNIRNVKLWSRGIHPDKYSIAFRSEVLRATWGAQNKKVILYAGRFVRYKDLETFINVYELFKKHGPDNVVFVLAGDGPIRNELKKRMPDAHFPGYLQNEKLSQVYASSDIFLFPSTTETFGNVVLEALSSGLPAVVSDVNGSREIVEKSNAGLVAKARDASSFYQHCKRLVQNQPLYETLRNNGLKFAEERSWTKINHRVIDEYQRITMKVKKRKPVGTPIFANI